MTPGASAAGSWRATARSSSARRAGPHLAPVVLLLRRRTLSALVELRGSRGRSRGSAEAPHDELAGHGVVERRAGDDERSRWAPRRVGRRARVGGSKEGHWRGGRRRRGGDLRRRRACRRVVAANVFASSHLCSEAAKKGKRSRRPDNEPSSLCVLRALLVHRTPKPWPRHVGEPRAGDHGRAPWPGREHL
jgi:hypothetical protein